MKKISTILFAAALVSPACIWAVEPVTGTATVELYTANVVNINNQAFTCPNGPRTFEPNELKGVWNSEPGDFKYNPETGHYFIENFLNGGEKCTFEFAVGDTPRDYKVYSTVDDVNTWLMNPVRYDFEVFFKTADNADTYGLSPSQYTGYSIVPNYSMTNVNNWTHMIRIQSTNGQDMLGKFEGSDGNSYSFVSGMRIYVTAPQRSATGKIIAYEPVPAGTQLGDDAGTEAPSQAQYSYVVKDGDNYTVYIAVPTNGYNKCYMNSDTGNNIANSGMVLKMSFNKNTLVAGVEDIEADVTDANADVEYYNLQGIKIENPTTGFYICHKGGKVYKVILP